jgi:PRC-barrel domain
VRLSEILGCEVVDERGRSAGKVHDVRMVQDGPPIGQFGARLRLSGLIVGRYALGARFGYDRGDMKGPWLLNRVVGSIGRAGRYVEWERVRSIDPAHERIEITGSVDDLRPPEPLP